jgi:tetratricopeptide (TPR) repeat protein
MVIAVADHGEGLRDHGDHAHGVFLYDETARVPLIVDLPGFVQGARRVPAVVRTIDIMPTILDVLRLPPRPGAPGTSLWPLMDAQVKDLGLAAFSEAAMPLLQFGWSPLASLRKGKWKYVEAPKPELYDMQADPREKKNLAGTDTGAAGSLRGELQEIVREAARSAYGSESAGTGAEEAAKLRSLGYASARGSGREILTSNPEILMEGGTRGLPDPKDRVEMLERINKVYLAFGAGDFPATVSMARAILQTDPDNDNVREYLADSFRSMQRFDDALSEYGRLLAKNPENVDALLNVGWVQMNLGRMDEARVAMEKALAIHPGHTYALASLGDLAFVQGDFGKAVEYYRKVLLQRPNHVQSIMAMAKIFERNNKLHEAEVFYKRVTEINPKNIDAWLSLGWLQFNAKEYDDALKSLEGAGRIDPSMAELNLYRGDILLALNRLDEAEAQYQQGVTKAPTAPQGYHGLGLVAERRGDAGRAQRFFEQALKANPSFAPSRAQLERLRQGGVSGG